MGSLLHSLWDSVQHPRPGSIVDGLRLRESGVCCVGGQQDELIVSEMVGTLLKNMNPFVQRRTALKRKHDGLTRASNLLAMSVDGDEAHIDGHDVSDLLRGIQHCPDVVAKHRKAYQPTILDKHIIATLSKKNNDINSRGKLCLHKLPHVCRGRTHNWEISCNINIAGHFGIICVV